MDNCNVWATVDFGRGPVEIRCTETDMHTWHNCAITFNDDFSVNHRMEYQHQKEIHHLNIFDDPK